MDEIRTYKRSSAAVSALSNSTTKAVLFHGECERLICNMPDACASLIVSSPPYCMGKAYEDTNDIDDFKLSHQSLFPELIRLLKPGGSLCWQVGFHVQDSGVVTPLDFLVYQELLKYPELKLRNRIIWTFGHGQHCRTRFSGRHESVLWFTKGDSYTFDLDAVRIPQKYPGKLASRGPNKGKPSSNPLGKNPGDVWEIPNVKAHHVEKTDHPCQFPVGLAHRLVRALSNENDLVFDPFAGVSSTGVAALLLGRRFVGAEVVDEYVNIGAQRLRNALSGSVGYRPAEKEIHVPRPTDKVAMLPPGFASSIQVGL